MLKRSEYLKWWNNRDIILSGRELSVATPGLFYGSLRSLTCRSFTIDNATGILVVTGILNFENKEFHFKALSPEELRRWILSLKTCLRLNPNNSYNA